MTIAVMGTGQVGRRLASRLQGLGHEVILGSRTSDNADAAAWARESGGRQGTFAEAAAGSEVIVNATGGTVSLAALTAAGPENLAGKVIVDVSNPLQFVDGSPRLAVPAEGSVAEQLQAAFPTARVVKTLNTMNNELMVDPTRVPGSHNVFLSGDDDSAKADVAALLRSFGWTDEQIIDLGGVRTARSVEPVVLLWVSLSRALGTADFNLSVVRPE
ncbi:NAD(P)-binding domain-containing protein [Nocardia amamiensis]|uniref:NAD(P)-binding domain-containing protein n=1 Tax=Nocardia amamiensis TaxID=404578 RepID=A0ABS0CXY4_9NOCA|nr:NAD(P)-binding domain-containing protein [Nocardia amamiensis]MBF6301465.1 NAD(P)-binding domain-containing protein [Nocardia amamiensis]